MRSFVTKCLNHVTMYRLMVLYIGTLLGVAIIFSATGIIPYYNAIDIAIMTGYFFIACQIFNKLFAKIFRVKDNNESAIITALILALIFGPLPIISTENFTWKILIVTTLIAFIAMASKYLIVWNKRHIFNPAAFGVLVSAIVFHEAASWWIGNELLLVFVLIGGLLMIYKIERFHLVLSFLLSYLMLFLGTNFLKGNPEIFSQIKSLFLLSPLVFFSFVMLIEPLTGPQRRKWRIVYGVIIGIALFLYQEFLNQSYTLELALLTCNIFACLTNSNQTIGLRLKKKEILAKNTIGFWFESEKKINFLPGQYLECTLPHKNPDNRGMRRYFSFASSPQENAILIATKFSEKSSSFKKALHELKQGDELSLNLIGGDFVLPRNTATPLVFIAGGIGITPFRSMLHDMMDTKIKRPVTLFYANRTEEDIAWRKFFEGTEWGLKFISVITERDGHINAEMIQKKVPNYKESLFYLSGPMPMVKTFEKLLSEMGVPRGNIKRDYFPGYTE